MPEHDDLTDVLAGLREHGALGETSLTAAIEHAEAFLPALPADCRRVIDLGSGGGLPGLVLAVRLEHVQFVLVDRRERRTDLLRLACARLGLADRVEVRTADVAVLARDAGYAGSFDVATARAFGDPQRTLRAAAPFLRADGLAVVSEPPNPDGRMTQARWPDADVRRAGFRVAEVQVPRVRRFVRRSASPT